MSENYNEDDFVSPETTEPPALPDADDERRRVIRPVDEVAKDKQQESVPIKTPIMKNGDSVSRSGDISRHRPRRVSRSSSSGPEQKKTLVPARKTVSEPGNLKKFTVQIPDEMLRKFRIQALTEGKTYSALAVQAFQALLQTSGGIPAQGVSKR